MSYRVATANHDPEAALHDVGIVLGDFVAVTALAHHDAVYLTEAQASYVRQHIHDPRRHLDLLTVRGSRSADPNARGVVLSLDHLTRVA